MQTSGSEFFLSGIYAAVVTPRRPNSIESDAGALLEYMDAVVRAGVDGVVLFGSTGQFIHFDTSERMRTITLAIKRSQVPVLVNVSHSALSGAIALAEHAAGAGAAGVLLMPPYFYRYSSEQIGAFYAAFSKALHGAVPVYLYNLPDFTNPLDAELAANLLLSQDFAGIKDSSGDWALFESLRKLRGRQKFSLLVGSESLFLRARQAGADGMVSGIAAAFPELPVAIDRALAMSDWKRAERLDARLQEFVSWVNRFPSTTAIRAAAIAREWPLQYFALPFDEDAAADLIAFQQWFRAWLPAVLSEINEPAAVTG
ncbi:MAG TPA: dihydrodipicolinate synthase family protein [Bryobacteraceae bacterium]